MTIPFLLTVEKALLALLVAVLRASFVLIMLSVLLVLYHQLEYQQVPHECLTSCWIVMSDLLCWNDNHCYIVQVLEYASACDGRVTVLL